MNSVVVGLQWGDEGKGKVVTYLSRKYDCVVRYSGGSNAGHTVDYGQFKLVHHLVPSADLRLRKGMYIASGVAVDLSVLLQEIEQIENLFPGSSELLQVSKQSHVVVPFYRELDGKIDVARSEPVGTTRRGIGLCYANRALRFGIRLEDFEEEQSLEKRLAELTKVWNLQVDTKLILSQLLDMYRRLSYLLIDSVEAFEKLRDKDLLFEATQGVLLDVDAGTYPYVTSTNCSSSGVQAGFGFPVRLDKVIGVTKAYTTRVGEGPFPTELKGEEGEKIRRLGGEYGATTGRPRRCGWLDFVLLRYAVKVSGCDELILTKADVLNGFERLAVCVAYDIDGVKVRDVKNLRNIHKAEPLYEEIEGWRDLGSLSFERFLKRIEQETGVKISHVSTGPKVEDIVEL
ncbi:MAG: adenylosuccinate synthase [Pseudothermotoga sp.]|uniref:adenylosuccinate synthase n=1 Tax=Pseudothermotoga sp. TaxID=2033661 RepID=UPI000AA32EF3|nr:adenylosuccinate synthase [Pseudothermotoga sp.]MDK2923954.1 adenylosuccinate synthase [Pseudothermotoga sp.]HBT40134.1 adenylosuccinate synthase [Pseudothermotoga sp.]HCO98833.1 adenylosuccinate synthase [Pseudothermotoga sp.]